MKLQNATVNWGEAFSSFLKPQVIRMLFLGFSAGLPIVLIFGTLSLWLNEAGINKATITFFSWAALGYSFKFIWAPLVDRLPLPFLTHALGRRRAWLLASQVAIIFAICFMAGVDPGVGDGTQLKMIAVGAVILGFSSATQDIVIDAYRIETGNVALQPMMSSMYMAGYRIGMLVAGAGALYLASGFGSSKEVYSYQAWSNAYLAMAAFALVGVATTLIIQEPEQVRAEDGYSSTDYLRFFGVFICAISVFVWVFGSSAEAVDSFTLDLSEILQNSILASILVESCRLITSGIVAAVVTWLLLRLGIANSTLVKNAYLAPIADFFNRYSIKVVIILLLLVGFYRISDIVLGVIANLFYQDLGYTKIEIANVSKTFGLLMIILGGFLGGVLTLRWGVMRILFLGAFLSAVTNLLFVVLSEVGHFSVFQGDGNKITPGYIRRHFSLELSSSSRQDSPSKVRESASE